jgi:hypothetical protein
LIDAVFSAVYMLSAFFAVGWLLGMTAQAWLDWVVLLGLVGLSVGSLRISVAAHREKLRRVTTTP